MLNEEDYRNEYKIKLTKDNKFEKEVISFLNTNGGNIFIGFKDNGEIYGLNGNLDLLQRTIKDRIISNIRPSTIGLFDVLLSEKDNKKFIQVVIAKGQEAPYYLKGMGMTPDSCFIRIGSSLAPMSQEMINNIFSKRVRNSLKNIVSPNQNLTFKTLKLYYSENNFEVNNNFLKKLDLYTEDNKFNYLAYLLADNNDISIQLAKYNGNDVNDLIQNEEYGHCSLVQATDNILNRLKVENTTFTKIDGAKRKEIQLFNYVAVREIVTNAFVHNDWSNGYSPKFELFNNKLVISSNGGIPDGTSQEEFLEGFSNPKNPELMRVYRDLQFVERLGTGIQRYLKVYSKDSFEFFQNHIRVNIPFNENNFVDKTTSNINKDLNDVQNFILNYLKNKSNATQDEIASELNVSKRTILRNFKVLVDKGYITKNGTTSGTIWKIN